MSYLHAGVGRSAHHVTSSFIRGSRPFLAAFTAASLACHSTPFDPAEAYGISFIRITPDSVAVSAEPSVFNSDGAADLSVVYFDSAGEQLKLDIAPVWSSSDESIAKVGSGGSVLGIRPGSAWITATVGTVKGYAMVDVRPAADTGITIAAHRGFRKMFPENTIVAITGAFDLRAEAVEVDVRLTIDRVPILMHDSTVDRTTDGSGYVRSLAFAQVRQLDACSRFGSEWEPCKVPTLQEALEAARGRGTLLLDFEGSYTFDDLVSLIDLLRDEQMLHNVVITSYSYPVLQHLRLLDSSLSLGLLTNHQPPIADVVRLGRAAAMPDQRALLADPQTSTALVRSAYANNVDVMTWVAADQEDVEALVALGVRHIMADVPIDKSLLR